MITVQIFFSVPVRERLFRSRGFGLRERLRERSVHSRTKLMPGSEYNELLQTNGKPTTLYRKRVQKMGQEVYKGYQ